ncbi:MAG: hydroxyethylthiazole kinase [Proteobacteria bacterium]|nr:hydroxyethylthiazole kinase [Pseudomonadota bacterium]
MTRLTEQAVRSLEAIRGQKPLIHNITNYVVMNTTANALLAMGASPVMAHAIDEVEEMVSFAGALVLNIGTLSGPWVEAMLAAGKRASELGKPVILDPVGAGATRLRTETAKRILSEIKVSVVRGNASEILALRDAASHTKGVDAVHSVDEAIDVARQISVELHTTLAITGATDLVTDGRQVVRIENGHPLMALVTGMGCTATALVGAFSAVEANPVNSAAAALAYLGLAGENAAGRAEGPGSFMVALLDALYTITPEDLGAGARIVTES